MNIKDVIKMLDNLRLFIQVNKNRDSSNLSTICKDAHGDRERETLFCGKKDESGNYLVACEDCPFFSKENAEEAIEELEFIIKKQKLTAIITQQPYE